MGSGTTGKVATRMGRNFIGIELHEDYMGLCLKRLGLRKYVKFGEDDGDSESQERSISQRTWENNSREKDSQVQR
jgi:DNA modification methylase